MKLIVAVDEKWGIGRQNGLLFSVPEDMKFFRRATEGKVIVVGRKTLESFPGGKPLKNRVNIVITTRPNISGAVCVNGLAALMREIGHFPESDVFVCGGASIYELLLDYCDEAFVTKISALGSADAFFPNLDERANWELKQTSEETESNGYKLSFTVYKNNCVKKYPK